MKKCTKCLKEKNEIDFYGKHTECKSCFKKRRRKHYEVNKERIRLQQRKHYKENREKVGKKVKKYYEANKEKISERNKQYYKKNREREIARNVKYEKERRLIDNKYRLRRNIHALFGRFLKGRKSKKFEEYVGYSYNDLISHLGGLKEGYHVDHIIPKSLYNLENKEEIKKCWSLRNLRLISLNENLKKGSSIDWNLIEQFDLYDLLPERVSIK